MKLGVLGYIRKNNNILMLYRNRKENDMHEGKWVAPGGHIEHNETPYEALVREIKEETGLEVLNASLRILLTFPEDNASTFGDLWYGYVFLVNEFRGDITECAEGDLAWIPEKDILDLPVWEGDKIFTPYVFKKGLHDIKLVYQDGILIDHKISDIG